MKSLKASAQSLQQHLHPALSRGESSSFTLPYYQAYTLLHWQPRTNNFSTKFSKIDERELISRAALLETDSDQAWLRHKQRAALLHLASTIGFKTLPLAGEEIIVSLADGSIRDFLEILGFIYEAYAKHHRLDLSQRSSLDKFAASGSQISAEIQTVGIYGASRAYVAGVGARAEKDFDVLLRFINGLGHYTSLLQSDHDDPTVFGRPERGVFSIRFEARGANSIGEAAMRERTVWNTIRQAELSGYLRTADATTRDILSHEEPDGSALIIRLHRRFGPYYQFSYRGPYEVSMLRATDLWQLCDRVDPVEPRSWAETMAGKVTADQQEELPLSWAYSDE